ncbi:hypothetical protein DYB32_000335 [Aphanomyces invadans]|uniref:Uncharacterized protein n=1 Tax=Aphanomyces invadans TaxID=157072 RepID=A0A3R7AG99_9STRA|nr:hypothetical protein DYB32_000335 [Aphanomyces invadans]
MATKQADKFLTLLSEKLKQLTDIALTQDELNDKLGTAIATLPNGALKATLQRNLDVYSKRLGRLLEASLQHRTKATSEKLLCEADYDILLSQNNTTKLVEQLSVPPSVFANFVAEGPASSDDPIKIVDAVVQLANTATQELATNGFTSVYPAKQDPHAAIAFYASNISTLVRSWMGAVRTNESFDVFKSRQLQLALSELLKVIEFCQLQDVYGDFGASASDTSFSFYLPNDATSSTSPHVTSALAHLYASYVVLTVFYPSRTPLPAADHSDDDDLFEDIPPVKSDPVSVASQCVVELLVTSDRFDSSWLVDVLLAANQLPRPTIAAGDSNTLLMQFNRVVLKALRRLTFQPNMSPVEFVRGVLFVRQAKALLRRTRQANAPQLTSIITRLTSLAIPFKLIDWMTLVARGTPMMSIRVQHAYYDGS